MDCSQPLYLRTRKKKWVKLSAKHAGVGVGYANEANKKTSGAVDLFEKTKVKVNRDSITD